MLNTRSQWKKRCVSILACSFLLTPSVVNAESVSISTPENLQNSSSNPISADEFVNLMNKSAHRAGKNVTFSMVPADTISREQVAVTLHDALHLSDAPEPFDDVADESTFAPIAGSVFKAKLMVGTGASHFEPVGTVTYSQAYALANKVFEYLKPFEIVETAIEDIQTAIDQGKLTSKQLVQMYLDRIQKYDHQGVKLNAIITVNPKALEIAEALDKERAEKGPRGPLHGIPVIVKDNFNTDDMPTTGGCLCLKGAVPSKDAFQITKLKEAGAIILGKANLAEFAFAATTTSSLGGQTLNPYALGYNPGGSSGGTAAAVAANFALAGFGSDTGASIRIPASYNNLVGLRPTVGLSSRAGIMPLAATQDTGAPIARTVTDLAILLDATVGYDPEDVVTAYSVGRIPKSYTDFLDANGLKGARIGVATELFGTKPNEKPNTDLVNQAVKDLQRLGAETVQIKIPNLDKIAKITSLSRYEFKFQFNDYLAKYFPNAKYHTLSEIIESGQYYKPQEAAMKSRDGIPSLDTKEYKDLLLSRNMTQESLLKVMADNHLDAIVYPSTEEVPMAIGQIQNPGLNARISPFSGFPAITVPAGFTSAGFPTGIEFLGRPFEEPKLIKFSYAYEQGTHHRKAPALVP
jgi:amidase